MIATRSSLERHMEPSYEYRATVLRWVDGDTVDLRVDVGFCVTIKDRFRLVGPAGEPFDAPEVRGPERPEGLAATERVKAAIPEGSEIVVRTFSAGRGKYGRWLAWVPGAIEAVT